jgi:hypothetical protein
MEEEASVTSIKLNSSVLKFYDYLDSAKGKKFLEEFCLAGYNAV